MMATELSYRKLYRVFVNTTQINKRTLFTITVFALLVSILSLIVPIAAQTLVNTIAFGTLFQPIVVLTLIVFITLLAAGSLRLVQAHIVENIEQKIFVNLALKLAKRLPRLKLEMLTEHRGPELVNHFFEVATVQKSMTVLMIYVLEIFIQAITGFLLLAIYHPIFLAFDIALMLSLFFILYLPAKKALSAAFYECEAKHKVASWLEEYTHGPTLFKLSNYRLYPFIKVDESVVSYLKYRKQHFKKLLFQLGGLYFIYATFNAGLLGLGGYLVTKSQLSLGQLVAAEIVLNTLIYGFIRLGHNLADMYNLLASCMKIQKLFELPYEQINEINNSLPAVSNTTAPIKIEVNDLTYKKQVRQNSIFNLSFTVEAKDNVVILGAQGSGKSILIKLLLGIITPLRGSIKFNQIPMHYFSLLAYRQHVAVIKDIDIVHGSFYENLCLHNTNVTEQEIYQLLNRFALSEIASRLPQGLQTSLIKYRSLLSSTELLKLMFIRAVLAKPSLLIIDGALDGMANEDIATIVSALNNLAQKPTTLITTRHEKVANFYTHKIKL